MAVFPAGNNPAVNGLRGRCALKRKIILVVMMCMLGLAVGMGGRLVSLKASSPESGCPVTVEGIPSVVYDETWRPLTALVTAKNGDPGEDAPYEVCVYNFNTDMITFNGGTTRRLEDATAGEFGPPGGLMSPKFKVTRWQVNGHAHFK
jgi:hypothetical protein